MRTENEKTTEKIVKKIVGYFNDLGYMLSENQIWSLLVVVYNSLGTEKEVGSREALSVARGSSHEALAEQGEKLRDSPAKADTTPSEMPDVELEKLQAIYSEGYATADEEKRLKEIFEEKRGERMCKKEIEMIEEWIAGTREFPCSISIARRIDMLEKIIRGLRE